MDPTKSSTPPPPPVMGAPVGYPPTAYPPAAAAAAGAGAYAPQLYAPPAAAAAQQAVAAQQQLQMFWAEQYREIEATTDFKNHNLPLARIKKIMKADEDVRMIAAEAPVVFARACEMFILELTHRGWAHAEENKRRTLQKSDIAAAIARTEVFDFLVDIVPRDDAKDADAAAAAAAAAAAGIPRPVAGVPATDPLAYYYAPQQ
ncbi:nuclear transcription factor Y subunit C-6-like [Phragmites australis]|uniref:nuclear transcription factor Y subunit C-6-like n=1 Tax=Phragmites australis TaxID=29695 RepID=UPI002D78B116|nr:nuclear transcription factor Y subunit C-6-like [Phragmites australis]